MKLKATFSSRSFFKHRNFFLFVPNISSYFSRKILHLVMVSVVITLQQQHLQEDGTSHNHHRKYLSQVYLRLCCLPETQVLLLLQTCHTRLINNITPGMYLLPNCQRKKHACVCIYIYVVLYLQLTMHLFFICNRLATQCIFGGVG